MATWNSAPSKSKALCVDCRENYYNGNNEQGIAECWNYALAKVVTRYRIGWWTPMDNADNFDKVRVLNCYCQTGRNAYLEALPAHLVTKQTKKRKSRVA